ncbi:IclR family transcriptional regulator C-terminal domain-containing protein [Streptomyces olivaceoviridis]
MLADLDDAGIRERLAHRQPFEARTPWSITSLDTLLADVRDTRSAGHAVDDQETAEGIVCVAAAVPGLPTDGSPSPSARPCSSPRPHPSGWPQSPHSSRASRRTTDERSSLTAPPPGSGVLGRMRPSIRSTPAAEVHVGVRARRVPQLPDGVLRARLQPFRRGGCPHHQAPLGQPHAGARFTWGSAGR